MGLITALVLLPLSPMRGVLWVAEKITDEVNHQYYGEGAIVKQLRQVEQSRETGKLNEEEAAEREEELLQRRLEGAGAPPDGVGHG